MNVAKSKRIKIGKRAKTTKSNKSKGKSTFARSGGVQGRFPIFGSVNTRVQVTDNWIPPRQLTKIRYAENFAISASGTGGLATTNYTYNISGAFDPRVQLGGGQPINWDLLVQQYDRYLVLGAKIQVTFSNPLYDGMYCGVRLRSATDSGLTSGKTIDELLMNRDLVKMNPINNTGSQVRSYKFYVKPYQILGIREEMYKSDVAFSSVVTANPIQYPLLEPFAMHTVAGEDSTIRCYVEIQYYVLFSEKNTIYDI